MQKLIILLLCIVAPIKILLAAPHTSLYLDELGTASYPFILDDAQASYDGTANSTPSTGNAGGKICSALDFTANTTQDFALLNKNSLDGATDFTVSFWHKGTSTTERSFLSGARSAQNNELIMWFTNGNRFNGYINGASSSAINFPSIADNQWHHIAWRRSGTQSCLFTDGVQRGCNTISAVTLNIESLIMGQEQDNVGGNFDINQDWESLVDEFLVFRGALSNAEIQSIYTNQNAGNSWDGGVRTCQTTPPPPPPVNYSYSDWRFDEDSWNSTTNEVIDSSSGNHGIAYASTTTIPSVPGKICNAIDLRVSSTQDYVKLGASSLDGVSDFTISAWHKGTSNNSRSLLSGSVAGSTNELIFWLSSATSFNGHLKNKSLGGVTTGSFNNNNWHHLVWTRTGGQSCFYLDTQLQGCQGQSNLATLNITSLVLGQEQDTVGGGFSAAQDWEGIVDELLIFKRSLDSTAISSIYNHQNNGNNWDGSHRACPNMPDMKLTKTSTVISDPINLSSNPKRIPGSQIRYSITAENNHATAAENVVITDILSDEISSGSIHWVGNMKISSPNINSGATTALTDTSDVDQGQFVSNILTAQCGNITNVAPCILTYDIEVNDSP